MRVNPDWPVTFREKFCGLQRRGTEAPLAPQVKSQVLAGSLEWEKPGGDGRPRSPGLGSPGFGPPGHEA